MPLGVRMDSGVKALRDEDAKTVLAEIKTGTTARIIAAFAPLMRGATIGI